MICSWMYLINAAAAAATTAAAATAAATQKPQLLISTQAAVVPQTQLPHDTHIQRTSEDAAVLFKHLQVNAGHLNIGHTMTGNTGCGT